MSAAEGHPETSSVAQGGDDHWTDVLLRQAPLELARAVYGLNDCAKGRYESMAAAAVQHALDHGAVLTRERAEQRARSYLPLAGHEHCPRCWVFGLGKNPLQYSPAHGHGSYLARCPQCKAEYVKAGTHSC